mmetsp:Transcript_3135/g.3019  ORF Transcript_3135/g.3019 Transcript_3135/m.3019 type:complete len:103 (+) Transcript_3135:1212-1520(+)
MMKIILSRDDEEFLVYEIESFQEIKHWYKIYVCSLYAFEWPYICYLKGKNEIMIQNTFSTNVAFVLRLPQIEQNASISHLFLTSALNLYICIRNDDEYLLYC